VEVVFVFLETEMQVFASFIYASLYKYPAVQMNKTEPSIQPQKYET